LNSFKTFNRWRSVQPLRSVQGVGISEKGLSNLNGLNERAKPASRSLHHHRHCFAAADAQTGDAAAEVKVFERIKQRGKDPRAARTDGMAQSDGATSNVDFSGVEAEFSVHSNGNHCKSFVDLEQVHRLKASASPFHETGDCFGRSSGEPSRVRAVT